MTYATPFSVDDIESRLHLRQRCGGDPYYSENRDVIVSRSYATRLEPEHRIKPKNLLRNLTGRDLVFTQDMTSGRYTRRVVEYGSYCKYPPTWLETVYRSYDSTWTSPDTFTFNYGDWVTPLRNQVANLKVQVAEDMAEYRKSSQLFHESSDLIVNAWKAYKGRTKRLRQLTMCDVAAAELIYSYGIAPSLQTLYDSMEELRWANEQHKFIKLQQSCSGTGSGSFTSGTNGYKSISYTTETKQFAKVYLTMYPGQPNFTLGNPIALAWNLLPYSFLIDYMIPIGDYLTSLSAMFGVTEVSGTLTTRKKYRCTTSYGDDLGYPPIVSTDVQKVEEYTDHQRGVLTSIPLPPLPRWQPTKSWRKLMNSIALLANARGCKARSLPRPRRR